MLENNAIVERVRGRWFQVLLCLGIAENFLVNKHGPCPLCGGVDRYRWDDKNGRGTYYCKCGPGDGFQLLMKLHNWTFPETASRIEEVLGGKTISPVKQQTKKDPSIAINKIITEASEVKPGDEVSNYLNGRGFFEIPMDLMFHPVLYESDSFKKFPAMIGLVRNAKEELVSIHRTFVKDGMKAAIPSPRKMMPPIGTVNGAAIRLYPLAEHIGIAEGIETSMAANKLFNLPVWSVLNANGIKTFIPPEGIRKVTIFADNDSNFAGQSAAYVLANRLSLEGYQAQVKVPELPGQDWWDVYQLKYE